MKILFISSLLVLTTVGGPVTEKENFQAIIDTVNSSGAKWKAGNSFIKGKSISSLKRLLGAQRNTELMLPKGPTYSITDSDIPEQFDARDNWPQCPSIKHIRDQGNCGSCWAVSSASAFTDRLCIATNGSFTEPLSAEEVMTCCTGCGGGDGCYGGGPDRAWVYFMLHGIVTGGDYNSNEGCQPYEIMACSHNTNGDIPSCESLPWQNAPECQKKCTNLSYKEPFSSDHHKVKQVYPISSDIRSIQKEILAYGPVTATYTIYADFLTYQSGIYHHVTGQPLASHAIKIIGWGAEGGTPYWLVANSWRDTWGEGGFFRILRQNNECDIESSVVAGIPDV